MSSEPTIPLDRFEQLFTLVESINTRLTALEKTVDERLHDTRPIWEAVKAQLGMVEHRLDNMNRSIDQLIRDSFEVRTEQRRLDGRLTDLESKVS
jgi:chromosome segregation ATPase